MPIWSLTVERLDKLKKQIEAKKAEHDDLESKSEKDLWCKDLDDFVAEWEAQLKLDAEITTTIRRMGRRTSKKIGAGRGRKAKDDDDYIEKKPARAPKASGKPAEKQVPTKSAQRFQEMFNQPTKPSTASTQLDGDDLSDDDFAGFGKITSKKESATVHKPDVMSAVTDASKDRTKRAAVSKSRKIIDDDDDDDFDDDFDIAGFGKTTSKKEDSDVDVDLPPAAPAVTEATANRAKRAAAAKPKRVIDLDSESDGDDDGMLGDVGAMVKGIGKPAAEATSGRLSLFAMSRPETSHGDNGASALPKVRAKPSRTFDFDSHDDTNYEALALSSPRKSTKADEVDELLSDDDELPVVSKTTTKASAKASSSAAPKAPLGIAKKGRGRPAGAKNKPKEDKVEKVKATATVAKKPVHLSPMAKAYATKKAKASSKQIVLSDDEDEDEVDAPDSPIAKPRVARPGRAAAAKKKPAYFDDDDEDEDSFGGGKDSDDFDMDDSE